MNDHANHKRIISGVVVSDRMNKTRVVAVVRTKQHPKYLKYFKVTTRFHAHDEKNEYKKGDAVRIQETRPMSALKRWIIIGRA